MTRPGRQLVKAIGAMATTLRHDHEKEQLMSESVDISGIPKPRVLAALYNASKQQGMGLLHQRGAEPMTEEQAAEEFEHGDRFDYLHGRVMKVNLSGDDFHPWGFDRDNGQGAAARAVDSVRG